MIEQEIKKEELFFQIEYESLYNFKQLNRSIITQEGRGLKWRSALVPNVWHVSNIREAVTMQIAGHRSHIGGNRRWVRNKFMQAIIEEQVKTWNLLYVGQAKVHQQTEPDWEENELKA